ncbi:MAG TPA: PA2169 family four-helix-bundle protein [Bryobacteraceae bacterium]|nr:PA2169 family four-helix-bundle protein [Bryobacteraceae bacterium]
MAHDQREALALALRDLTATCRDAEEGYNKAAKGVHSDELRAMFDRLSLERARFAEEIKDLLRPFSIQPEDQGHGGGILRRGWVDLEQRNRPKDDMEIVENCVAGDEGSLPHYDHALTLPFNHDVTALIRRQREAIRAAVEALRNVGARS